MASHSKQMCRSFTRMRLGSTDSIAAILPDPIVTHGHVLKMFDRAPRESETSMHAWLLLHGGHRFRKHYAQVVDNAFPGETSLSEYRPSLMDLDHTEENEAIPECCHLRGWDRSSAGCRAFGHVPSLAAADSGSYASYTLRLLAWFL
jgi:hypothetical protein